MGKNLAKRMTDEQDTFFNAGLHTGLQFGQDLMARAAKACGVSKRQIIEITKLAMQYSDDYWGMLDTKLNAEADYLQERFDGPLKEIYGELYCPFTERYEYIKRCQYEPKKRR